MDGTADKSTPLWMPWREALKRAGSFDALRPYLQSRRTMAGSTPCRIAISIAGPESSGQKSGPTHTKTGPGGE
jgi:hypothetical protein